MNIASRVAIAFLLCIAGSTSVLADDDLWFGVKAGTLGLGVEATWRPLPYLDLRAGLNRFSFSDEGSEAGINYDADFDLRTYYATANLRAPMTPFRITAGVFSNGNEASLTSQEAAFVNVGGGIFPGDQVGTLNAGVDFDGTAPYTGVGLDFRIADTVGLSIDLGVLWQGEPDVRMAATGPLANDALFQAQLEAERAELESELDDFEIYPVASIGFSWNF